MGEGGAGRLSGFSGATPTSRRYRYGRSEGSHVDLHRTVMAMSIKSRTAVFVESVAKLRFENAFNPYSDVCPDYDVPEAATARRRNLQLVLESALRNGIDS